jgi:hypothetical protein
MRGNFNKGEDAPRFKHGECGNKTSEYMSWESMCKRCRQSIHYKSNGITVCEEWKNSYLTFLNDMGRKPKHTYSIDRIDNSKGYYKENCRWTDRVTQQRNQAQSKWVTINGERKHIIELSQEYGISYNTLRTRYNRGVRGEQILVRERERKPKNTTKKHL